MHVVPFAKIARSDIQTSLIRGVGTARKNFSCQGLKVWLDLKIMVYVDEKGCEQVSHVVMAPVDKSTFYTRHCMINVESLAARTSIWEVLQCPAEHIVEFPFVQVEVL